MKTNAPAPAASLTPGIVPFEDAHGRGFRRSWRWPWDCFLVLGVPIFLMCGGLIFFATEIIREEKWDVALYLAAPATPVFFFTYLLIATLFNRTEVGIGRGHFRVWHGPVPWFGSKTLPLGEVQGFTIKEKISTRSSGPATTSYELKVIGPRQKSYTLFSGQDSEAEARTLQKELEAHIALAT